ncbi:MAG: hypothetical protein MUC95_10490 [Spirochaetes bacterium]|nr:hypothetical protein [Spirochaetota bacterium]
MKEQIVTLIIASVFIAVLPSCVTPPAAIDDVFLSEIKPEEADKMRRIEGNIVQLKNEKDKTETELAVAEQVILVSESEVAMLEATGRHLQEREKLFTMMVDNQKLSEEQAKIAKNRDETVQAKKNLSLNKAKRDEAESLPLRWQSVITKKQR